MSENEMNVQTLYSHPYYAKDGKLYIEKQMEALKDQSTGAERFVALARYHRADTEDTQYDD